MAQRTNDPTRRYSDEELDPFEQEWQNITQSPENQAWEDQVGADNRGDGGNNNGSNDAGGDGDNQSRGNPDGRWDRVYNLFDQDREEQDRLKNRDALRDAERKEWDEAGKWMDEQKFRYSQGERPTKNNKRRNIVTAAIVTGLLSIALAFFSLLPLKVPALMNMVSDEAGQLIEYATLRRAKVIMARAMLSKFGYTGGVVITGNGPVSSLIASMRTDKFTKKLSARGIDLIEVKGEGVKIRINGNYISGTLKSEKEIIDAFENNRNVDNTLLTKLVKEEIPVWRIHKRLKFAGWLRQFTGIPRYGVKDSKETDPEKRKEDIHKSRVKAWTQRTGNLIISGFGCFLGEASCPVGKDKKSVDQVTSSDARNQMNNGLGQAGDEFTEEATKKIAQEVTESYYDFIIKKLGTKAIPIVGWIDLVATIDHIAYNAIDDDYFQQIPSYFRGVAYAQMYAEYAGYGSQIQLGEMDRGYIGVIAKELDGAETSAAFNYIQNGSGKGKQLTARIDENNPSAIKKIWEEYKASGAQNVPGNPLNQPAHLVLNAYYETIGGGGLLGWIGGAIGDAFSKLTSLILPDKIEQWFADLLTSALSKIASSLGWAPDFNAIGADKMNYIFAGAEKAYNESGKEMGMGRLSPTSVKEQRKVIAQERARGIKEKGWLYAMFSPNYTKSLSTQLAVAMPSAGSANLSDSISQLASLVASAPSRLLNTTESTAGAAPYNYDFSGVWKRGLTETEMSRDVDLGAYSSDPCKEVEENATNACKVDKRVADCILAYMSDDQNIQNSCVQTEVLQAGDTSVMSYNILGSNHGQNWADRLQVTVNTIKTENPDIIGFQEVNDAGDQRGKLKSELSASYDMFPAEGDGWQDAVARPIYWNKAKWKLATGTPNKENSFNAIKNNPQTGANSGLYVYPRYSNSNSQFPWVKLESLATPGYFIYAFNTHFAAGGQGSGKYRTVGLGAPPVARREEAKMMKEQIEAIVPPGSPVVVTGDFNSTCEPTSRDGSMTTDEIPCNILKTSTFGFKDAGIEAAAKGKVENYNYSTSHNSTSKLKKKGELGNPDANGDGIVDENELEDFDEGRHIDHVMYSQGIEISAWKNVITAKGSSDHTPVIAYLVTGAGGGTQPGGDPARAGSMIWPIAKSDWPSGGMPIAECGLAYSGGTVHTGIDISVTRKPVRAAADGKVTMTGGAYGAIIIETDLQENGKKLYLNYQHLGDIKVSVGQRVTQNQIIGTSGNKGTGAFHLHFGVWTTGEFLGGHMPVNSAQGKAVLAKMRHPLNYLPQDGRNISECKAPFTIPGGG